MPVTTYAFPEPDAVQNIDRPYRFVFVLPDEPGDADKDFLRRIAAALKADPDADILYLVNTPDRPVTIPSSCLSAAGLIVSFGVLPESFGWHIDLAGPGMCMLDRSVIILTLSPRLLQADAQAKKHLWAAMQDFLDRSVTSRP